MKMNRIMLALALVIIIMMTSCTDLKNNLPTPSSGGLSIHDAAWNDTTSPNFHGKVLKSEQYDLTKCISCHAKYFTGGISNTSCYTCHQSYPHKSGWGDSSSATYHGRFLLSGQGRLSDCAACHGTDYSGGTSNKSCYTCHASYPHKAGWMNTDSADYHGKYLKANDWHVNECAPCHGSNFDGGTSGKSCYQCHPSFPHEVKFAVEGMHAGYLGENGYPISDCKKCHGANYAGGVIVNISCSQSDCHRDAGGNAKSPEACNTCHGKFRASANDTISWAPPPAVNGIENSPSVGAHQQHLITGTIGKSVKCQECHTVPTEVSASGHIEIPFNVQVIFNDTLASLKTSGGIIIPTPAYSPADLSCTNLYCHGYFVNGNLTNSPTWNKVDGTQAACGTCHGNPTTGNPLPAGTHYTGDFFKNCALCHYTGSVPVAQYNSGTDTWVIVDRPRHVNGKLSRGGTEAIF
jgi:predicted CxxxxCH...CXXCH cytochrome family protein